MDVLKHIQEGKPKAALSLQAALALQVQFNRHITGTAFKDSLTRVGLGVGKKYFENEVDFNILKEIAAPQTPPLFQKFRGQFSKIYRADGFLFKRNFAPEFEELSKKVDDILDSVWNGESLFSFMKNGWEKLNDERPNDVILIELPKDITTDPRPYIRVIPIENVWDIAQKGSKIEWVIEKQDKKNEKGEKYCIYRYIGKDFDQQFIKREGESAVLPMLNEFGEPDIIVNRLGKCPAIRAGQIPMHFGQDIVMVNQYFFGLLLADKYQMRCNEHDLSVKKHAWPLFVSYPVTCDTCNGTGQTFVLDEKGFPEDQPGPNEGSYVKCKSCKGTKTKKFQLSDSADGVQIPLPMDAGVDSPIPNIPQFAGYVARDVETLKFQREVKSDVKLEIEESVMGAVGLIDRTTNNTATEALIDYQPLLDRMWAHSERAERVNTSLEMDILSLAFNTTLVRVEGEIAVPVQRYIDSTITYGKIYVLKSESQYDLEYKIAKEAGMPDTYLLSILRDKLRAKYQADDNERAKQLFLLEVMPYPTYTVVEMKNSSIGKPDDVGVKAAFNDILEIFETDFAPIETFIGRRKEAQEKFYEIYTRDIAPTVITATPPVAQNTEQ